MRDEKRLRYFMIYLCSMLFAALVVLFISAAYINILRRNIPVAVRPAMLIVLDAGHGGGDPGKPGNFLDEAQINLMIVGLIKERLQRQGYVVVMTRTGEDGLARQGARWDKAEDMKIRREIIEASRADIMLSIHCNSYPDASCSGAQVFYDPENAKAKALAQIIQAKLAQISQRENKRTALRGEDISLIQNTGSVSVTVECGFLSNPAEEQLLNTSTYREVLAKAICEGIEEYVKAYE